MTIKDVTGESKCCCSCKHNIRTRYDDKIHVRCNCDKDGHYIGYVANFGRGCGMSDLRMELIQGQLNDIEENVRSIKATWGNTIMTLDNIKSSLKADRQKAIDEAYLQGKHDAEQDLARAAYKEAYQNGYDEAKRIYKNPNAESDYQRGLDDAWEAARKICNEPEDGGLPASTVVELFGINWSILGCSAQNAINKIKAYEEQQKADAEIKVGDEVTLKSNNSNWLGVVVRVDDTNAIIMTRDGYTTMYRLEILKKTDKHFTQVAELLEAMNGGASWRRSLSF